MTKLTLVIALALIWFISWLPTALADNLSKLELIHSWMRLTPMQIEKNDDLNDGIPDGWVPQAWNGAKRVYRLDRQNAFAGHQSVNIVRTNNEGVAALIQDFEVTPGSDLVATLYAKGEGGAIQIRFSGQGGEWETKGWLDIPPNDDWQQYQLKVTVPADKDKTRLFLRTGGSIWFDEVYVGAARDGSLAANLVNNPGFEQDGIDEDPLDWWKTHTIQIDSLNFTTKKFLGRLSYMNVQDMLTGQYGSIQQRAASLGVGCVFAPDMTTWLTTRGNEFAKNGGLTAQEKIYQLAIYLAPNCPQPYAMLAQLYITQKAYSTAAGLYHQAAGLAGETTQAGRYYFEEGMLHIRYTGNMERALFDMQQSNKLSGWEPANWYRGANLLYLGSALESQGRFEEAAEAYQRVIDCSACKYHHPAARNRLEAIKKGQN